MNIRTNITKVMFSIIIGVAVATSADAANTMCVTSDNNSIILNPEPNGTAYDKIEEEKTWWTDFDYGRVSGIATCNSTQGEYARAYPEYNNFDKNHVSSEGVYCWCRMTSPVRSAWVYLIEYVSASECDSRCANGCGGNVRANSALRVPVFGSAGM